MEVDTVVLRPMTIADGQNAVAILQDALVKKTYMLPDLDPEGANKLFLRLMALSSDPSHYVRGIYVLDRLIGWINDTQMEKDTVELGWVIDSGYHNRGYGTAAVKLALHELHGKGMPVITAGAFSENAASIRVMEKAGMKPIAMREEIEYRGRKHLCVYYESRK